MSNIALLAPPAQRADDATGSSFSDLPTPGKQDLYTAAEAKANKLGPAAHEIHVHEALKLARDRSYNASGSFVHFSQHGLRNNIDDQSFLEDRSVRNLRRHTRWYDSVYAVQLRKCMRSRIFLGVSIAALFVALFFPDLFVLMQVPTNEELDAILCTAFSLFMVEWLMYVLSDPAYPFSFFFFMDLLGSLSMAFDISFVLGPDAGMPDQYQEKSAADGQFIVFRAARTARLGARAGRLSRVVKILRFLNSDDSSGTEHQVKMAQVISNKLSDVLSMRVAFLTICIAVVLPSFQMFEYPEMDESMIAWTQMVVSDIASYDGLAASAGAQSAAAQAANGRIGRELARFGRFYSSCLYGPFKVCTGRDIGSVFECAQNNLSSSLVTRFSAPVRNASILEIREHDFQVYYDMTIPKRMEAGMNIGLIWFIIMVMVVFSGVLSSSISVIALKPLERMLYVVRQHCKQIFKYTKDLQEQEELPGNQSLEEEEDEDVESKDSEFVLLEKAVSKLVAIAALSAKPQLDEKEMDERRAVEMGWAQGVQFTKNVRAAEEGAPKKPTLNKMTARLKLSVSGGDEATSKLSEEVKKIPTSIMKLLNTQHFDALLPNKEQKINLAAYVVSSLQGCAEFVQDNVPEPVLVTFVTNAEKLYNPNPFHNFGHALDVVHTLDASLEAVQAYTFLTALEHFWLSIAAIGHDLGHIGVNNVFLVETSHHLAVMYNDMSPLENLHCSKLFQIVSTPEANVFSELEKDEYKEVRKGIINAILHTDITKHNEMVKELNLLYQMHSQSFEGPEGDAAEVLKENVQHCQMVSNALLHCADIGNPMKPWDLCHKWANLCLDEYFNQGDKEKGLGIPVQMLNDREKVSRPNSQIGFMEFMLTPMLEAMIRVFPQLDCLAENLGTNIRRWLQKWIEEASPPEDAVEKVKLRVEKVVDKCQALIRPDEMEYVP